MTLSEFIAEIKSRNSLLYQFGLINLVGFAIALILTFTDPTVILGINAWIKPMKFALSVAIYCWTFAWILHYLPSERNKKIISWGVVICMFMENSLIFMQAGRGVRSHFNVTSAFDGMVFGVMGIFILINTLVILYTIILFFSSNIQMEKPLLWAWRAGLIFFFLGGISGGMMVSSLHHTVGGEDGGPGLPFFNWSTLFGDIRSAHFITMHGLQIIPIAALIIMKYVKEKAEMMVLVFSFLFLDISIFLHWLALNGYPLISLP